MLHGGASGSSPTATSERGSSPPACRWRAGGLGDDDAGVLGHARTGSAATCCSSCSSGGSATPRWSASAASWSGVVEDADLFAAQPRSWFGARRSIARAQDIDALAAAAGRLPEILLDLHASNLRALEIARVLSALVDALTVRALELAAPAARLPADGLVWVAVGSQARRELTPASVRAGRVVCSEPPPPGWRRRVGRRHCRAAGCAEP